MTIEAFEPGPPCFHDMTIACFSRRQIASFSLAMIAAVLAVPAAFAQSDRDPERQQWRDRRAETRQNGDRGSQQGYDPRAQQRTDEPATRRPEQGYDRVVPDGNPRGRGRMTPEERQELRDQVYEAGRYYRRDRQ